MIDLLATVQNPSQSASGAYPTISNAGVLPTNIGLDSTVGTIFSQAPVVLAGTLHPNTGVHGDVNSEHGVIRVNHRVTGAIHANTDIAFKDTTLTYQVPPIPSATSIVGWHQSVTLSPGAHNGYTLLYGATLRLEPGRHYMSGLNVTPGATLHVADSNAPVEVFVDGPVTFAGTLEEEGVDDTHGNFRVVVLGSAPTNVLTKFTGTIVAPKSLVEIFPGATPHEGAFFGEVVHVHGGTVIKYLPFRSSMITAVTADKTTLCENEPVNVTVAAHPLVDGDTRQPALSLDGKPGSTVMHQFTKPGIYSFVATASQDGVTDSRKILVTVTDCTKEFPVLLAAPNTAPYSTQLTVANPELFDAATYEWKFGDGTTTTTPYPSVSHDYSAALPVKDDFHA